MPKNLRKTPNSTQSQEQAIQKAIAFMQANLPVQLSLERIAEQVGYTSTSFCRVFKKATGSSVWTHLLELRIARARELLTETDLGIAEIAFESGFGSHEWFGNTFRKRAGMSPLAFRKLSRSDNATRTDAAMQSSSMSPAARPWFADDFSGSAPGSWWRIGRGEWVQPRRTLRGNSQQDAFVDLTRTLPENFKIQLGFRALQTTKINVPSVYFRIRDRQRQSAYCTFTLGRLNNSVGEAETPFAGILRDASGTVTPHEWQQVEMGIRDDTVWFVVDGTELFRLRNPIPPPQSSRCGFSMGAWAGAVEFKDLVVEDLGILPLVRSIREGDRLYRMDMVHQARDFYLRFARSEITPVDRAEVRYKIGMCFLGLEEPDRAREWMRACIEADSDRAGHSPESEFWTSHARLGLLECDRTQDRAKKFRDAARQLCQSPALRTNAQQALARQAQHLMQQGFREQSALLRHDMLDSETKDAVLIGETILALSDSYQQLGKCDKAMELDERLLKMENVSQYMQFQAIHNLGFLHTLSGRFNESTQEYSRIRDQTDSPVELARCEVFESFNIRAQGHLEKALQLLEQIPNRYRADPPSGAHAHLVRSHQLCGMGRPSEARRAIELAREFAPKHELLGSGRSSSFAYPPCLVEGDYSRATNILLEDGKSRESALYLHADQMTKAGIMYALEGDSDRARETWRECIRRFPHTRCNYYADLCEKLLKGEDNLEQMPYSQEERSEMFYVVSLLCEKQGNKERARQLLGMCLKEDPTRRWPAMLAKAKL